MHHRQILAVRLIGRACIGWPANQRLQILGQCFRGSVASLRLLFQALQTDRFQIAVDPPVDATGSIWFPPLDLGQRVQHGLTPKRRPSRQQRVQHRPEAVHVGGRGHRSLLSRRLLGRHVAGRPDDLSGLGQTGFAGLGLCSRQTPGKAKVGDVGLAVPVKQYVRRLQVTVQDAALVRVMDRACNGGHHLCRRAANFFAFPGHLTLGDCLREAAARDQFHAEIRLPVQLADFVDRHDVRMVQAGRGLGFGSEALQIRRTSQAAGPDHFHGHQAMEALLLGLVDHAHAALANLLEQVVIAKGAPLGWRRGSGGTAIGGCRKRRVPGKRSGLENRLGDPAQRGGQLIELVLTGEEFSQLGGKLGMAGQELRPIGGRTAFRSLDVLQEHFVEALVRSAQVGLLVGHPDLVMPVIRWIDNTPSPLKTDSSTPCGHASFSFARSSNSRRSFLSPR